MRNHTVAILKALADETRLSLLKEIIAAKEISCKQLVDKFSLSQPTLSHHFNKLVDAHVLNARKQGQSWFYTLNTTYMNTIGFDIKKIVTGKHHHE